MKCQCPIPWFPGRAHTARPAGVREIGRGGQKGFRKLILSSRLIIDIASQVMRVPHTTLSFI